MMNETGDAAPDWRRVVKDLRAALRLKQSAFAESLGVDQGTVSRWENSRQIPDPAIQRRLRDMLARQDTVPADAMARALVRAQPGNASLSGHDLVVRDFSPALARLLGANASRLRNACLRDIATERMHLMLDSHLGDMLRPGSPILSVSHTDVGALAHNVIFRRTWLALRVDGARMLLCQDEVIGAGTTPPALDLRLLTLDDLAV